MEKKLHKNLHTICVLIKSICFYVGKKSSFGIVAFILAYFQILSHTRGSGKEGGRLL